MSQTAVGPEDRAGGAALGGAVGALLLPVLVTGTTFFLGSPSSESPGC